MAGFRDYVSNYGQQMFNQQQMARPAASGFNPYAAGQKHYGGGRSFPTSGSVNKLGYAERDNQHAARRNAMLQRLQSEQSGAQMDPSVLRPKGY